MKAIVMADADWGIGKDGQQSVFIPADLKRFQALTTGHAIILGRKTLLTFPGGRPLKNRRNLILSTQKDFTVEGAEVFGALEALLQAAPEDSFVVGGGSVYKQLLPHCDTAYVTRLDKAFPVDASFPDLDAEEGWQLVVEEGPFDHEGLGYRYLTYEKQRT